MSSLGFSEIVPDGRHLWLGKDDSFGYLRKRHILLKKG